MKNRCGETTKIDRKNKTREGMKKLFPCCESEAGDIIGDEKCVYRVRTGTDNDNVYVRPETYRKIYDEVKLPGEE